jgi:hypothetical protein
MEVCFILEKFISPVCRVFNKEARCLQTDGQQETMPAVWTATVVIGIMKELKRQFSSTTHVHGDM